MKKMNEKRRLKEKVQGRIRGFVALMLAMVVAVGFMPMQSVKAASTEEAYYLICCEKSSVSGATQFLGYDTVGYSPDYWYKDVKHSGSTYGIYTGSDVLIQYNTSGNVWNTGSGIMKKVASPKKGEAYTFEVIADRMLYFGSWTDQKVSIFVKGEKSGKLFTKEGRFDYSVLLTAGKYKIEIVDGGAIDTTVSISKVIENIELSDKSLELKVGDPAKKLTVTPSDAEVTWTSSDTAVSKVSDSGEVTAVAAGTAVITATLKEDPTVSAECTVTVKASGEDKKDSADSSDYKKDDVLKDEKGNDTGYVVANPSKTNFQAQYKGTAQDKNASKVVIQDEIKDANGNVFKVTMISDGALENAQGKELVIGKNVKKIGNRALKGAKFKKITFRTNKKGRIQIGRNAFRVKSKKCTVKVKGAKGRYQKLLKNKILKQSSKGVSVKF